MRPQPCAHSDLMVDESLTEVICRMCGASCSVNERNKWEAHLKMMHEKVVDRMEENVRKKILKASEEA